MQRFDNVPRLFFPFLWVFWKLFYAVLTTAHWILNRTCRIDIEGHPEGRHILCGWHESIIPYSVAYRRLPLRYLVIQNNAWFMPPIIWLVRSRGAQSSIDISYSSFGKSTISKVTSQLAAGESLLAFPDGPSGPAHVLDRSLLVVAERSGAPIIPLRVETSMALVISWPGTRRESRFPSAGCGSDAAIRSLRCPANARRQRGNCSLPWALDFTTPRLTIPVWRFHLICLPTLCSPSDSGEPTTRGSTPPKQQQAEEKRLGPSLS